MLLKSQILGLGTGNSDNNIHTGIGKATSASNTITRLGAMTNCQLKLNKTTVQKEWDGEFPPALPWMSTTDQMFKNKVDTYLRRVGYK